MSLVHAFVVVLNLRFGYMVVTRKSPHLHDQMLSASFSNKLLSSFCFFVLYDNLFVLFSL